MLPLHLKSFKDLATFHVSHLQTIIVSSFEYLFTHFYLRIKCSTDLNGHLPDVSLLAPEGAHEGADGDAGHPINWNSGFDNCLDFFLCILHCLRIINIMEGHKQPGGKIVSSKRPFFFTKHSYFELPLLGKQVFRVSMDL